MSDVLPLCSGVVTSNPDGSIICSVQWQLIPVDQLLTQFDPASMDPAVLAAAFGYGFVVVATFGVVGAACRGILHAIKDMM